MLSVAPLFSLADEPAEPASPRPYAIAVVKDGPSQYFDGLDLLVRRETVALMEDKTPVTFIEDPAFNAQWDITRVQSVLDKALQDPQVDLVFAVGMLVAQEASRPDRVLDKPVISGFIQDPDAAGMPFGEDDCSTKTNFNFIVVPLRTPRDLEVFHQLIPFKQLAIVADSFLLDGLKGVDEQVRIAEERLQARITLVPAHTSAEEVLQQIGPGVDAVYLTPALRMPASEWKNLLDQLAEKKLPTFSNMGHPDVELGAMAGLAPECSDRLARRIALNVQQIIMGTPPEKLSVTMPLEEHLLINARTAAAVGYSPSIEVMTQTEFIHQEHLQRGERLTLAQAVQLALENNVDLAIKKAEVASVRQDRNRALSTLFPQAEAQGGYTRIDTDRAESSMGMQPESESRAGVQISQILYNDPLISQYRASRKTYEGMLDDQENTRLDIISSAAGAYLDLLQATALLQIEADNLKLTQSNLELARTRQKVGTSGPEEVYRWESQAASQKARVIEASSNVDKARIVLNQIMGVEMDHPWNAPPIRLGETNYYFLDGRLNALLVDNRSLAAFEQYAVRFGLRQSPLIKSLDKTMEASRIYLGQYRRRFVLPEVGLRFGYDRILNQQFINKPEPAPGSVEADDNEWSLALQASLPLFEGGRRVYEVAKAAAQLEQLRQTRARASQLTERNIKAVLYSINSSYPNMSLQKSASEFSQRNLDVIKDKYARGVVSILDLLDAQNQAFVAAQNHTLAVYQYLKDVHDLQRAISWFELDQNNEGKDQWIHAFTTFMETCDFSVTQGFCL